MEPLFDPLSSLEGLVDAQLRSLIESSAKYAAGALEPKSLHRMA